MWDSRAEAETAPPSGTTAGVVIAQNAGLAHGVAWVVASTAGPDRWEAICCSQLAGVPRWTWSHKSGKPTRSEEHTSELQSRPHLVCRLLLEKKKKTIRRQYLRETS